ncbi:MAG: malate synthase A [Acidimicrobiaceae bacterium]|nr:malate synthase A [Acidimicrobiaceae bacterium]
MNALLHTESKILIAGEMGERFDEILTDDALEFVRQLHICFEPDRREALARRAMSRRRIKSGGRFTYLPETRDIREDSSWRVAGAGPGLHDRRVEITGPTDRKMTINAMNSGARVWLADQEDATSPTWNNVIGGQISLYDAIRRTIDFVAPDGRAYALGEKTPTIVMRPRGWHLGESHLRLYDDSGESMSMSGSLVDFGLYFFHNAKALIEQGRGPYFYLAKTESHLEARLWDEVFSFAETYVGIPHGTIRATVLIETIPAAFEMEEILYELRDHCAGLNAGRWDYIFSIIKNFRDQGDEFVLPDRSQITMTVPFMRAYTSLLVETCHRRGAHAIGGMSAFIPNRRDPEVTARAMDQVRSDKKRESNDGFDGTWVAHPDLVPIAFAEFDAVLGSRPNQIDRLTHAPAPSAQELTSLAIADSFVSASGVRTNVSVGIRYIESWLRGVGAAAIDNLMEDAATAEISRSQIWQWIRAGVTTKEGDRITEEYVSSVIARVMNEMERFPEDRFDDAVALFTRVALGEKFVAFLTTPGYEEFFS